MKLSLRSIEGDVLSLQCEGWITQSQLKPGHDPFAQVCGTKTYSQRVLLDLEKTEFVDSSGIGWLMGCHKRAREAKGLLVLHSISPLVWQTTSLMRNGTPRNGPSGNRPVPRRGPCRSARG